MSCQDLAAAVAASMAEHEQYAQWEGAQHAALDSWLGMKGLQRYEVPADGNCQFWAFRWGLRRKGLPVPRVGELRVQVASYLRDQKDRFAESCAEDYDSWVDKVAMSAWGDHLTLVAMSEIYGCRIKVGANGARKPCALWWASPSAGPTFENTVPESPFGEPISCIWFCI